MFVDCFEGLFEERKFADMVHHVIIGLNRSRSTLLIIRRCIFNILLLHG